MRPPPLHDVLDEIEEYLAGREDVLDGEGNRPRPNRDMRLLMDLRAARQDSAPAQPGVVTKTGISLEWGPNQRDGEEHTEWHAPCGCSWHPRPAPHWHPCALHAGADESLDKRWSEPQMSVKITDAMLDAGMEVISDLCGNRALSVHELQAAYEAMARAASPSSAMTAERPSA